MTRIVLASLLLASLAACFLVYTGLALAYRRLIRPLLRRA